MQNKSSLQDESLIRLSSENIIGLVREHRNEMIQKLLSHDDLLQQYLLKHYKIVTLSETKLTYVKKALEDLATTRLDLEGYSALIREIRKNEQIIITLFIEDPFHSDIKKAIHNYI